MLLLRTIPNVTILRADPAIPRCVNVSAQHEDGEVELVALAEHVDDVCLAAVVHAREDFDAGVGDDVAEGVVRGEGGAVQGRLAEVLPELGALEDVVGVAAVGRARAGGRVAAALERVYEPGRALARAREDEGARAGRGVVRHEVGRGRRGQRDEQEGGRGQHADEQEWHEYGAPRGVLRAADEAHRGGGGGRRGGGREGGMAKQAGRCPRRANCLSVHRER
ncbi:unnamed protein product [Chondrus crispus]|uniref:Uncharacterized protein n=1 Tax=Chondrus crispus TaxID=2769 RepID=R7QS08_CHOCR|nr:unnamed protein product [Chondrus crispus]CDF40301.1 unnamed protein product [Chondrus crispus]|eukprot:XP_005710595.1 unnamed protein product [Chondrus crispus]